MSVAIFHRRGDAPEHDHEIQPPQPGRRASEVPYLRLVPAPAEAEEQLVDEQLNDVPPDAVTHIPVQRGPGRRGPALRARDSHPVRLTRRGRAVLWLLLLAVAITVAALLAPASQAAGPAAPPRAVTVHAGDTMWSIATKALPHQAPGAAVERIRVLNHLPDDQVFVGEQILVPSE